MSAILLAGTNVVSSSSLMSIVRLVPVARVDGDSCFANRFDHTIKSCVANHQLAVIFAGYIGQMQGDWYDIAAGQGKWPSRYCRGRTLAHANRIDHL